MGVILDANNQTEQNQQFISFKVALGISLNVNKQVQKRPKKKCHKKSKNTLNSTYKTEKIT